MPLEPPGESTVTRIPYFQRYLQDVGTIAMKQALGQIDAMTVDVFFDTCSHVVSKPSGNIVVANTTLSI